MKKEVGQFTFAITSPHQSNQVLFVVPTDEVGCNCPDVVWLLKGIGSPNPNISFERRQQAIAQAQKTS